ncbi:MAG: hypothetical protein U1G05_15090 [Kiritimatiellia bacterium]
METVDRHVCDRYAYDVVLSGPAAGRETGRLWLDATAPFALVRQVARSANTDGTDAHSYEVRLRETGRVQAERPSITSKPHPPRPRPRRYRCSRGTRRAASAWR